MPSLHCQRIARAKWEFLFGAPAEEACSRGKKSENMSLMFSFFVSQYVYIHVFVSGYRFDFFFLL